MHKPRIVVVGTRWRDKNSEMAYVVRSLAAAASQWAEVLVLVPNGEPIEADGAFDLIGFDPRAGQSEGLLRDSTIVVDDLTPEVQAVLPAGTPDRVFTLTGPPLGANVPTRLLPMVPTGALRRFVHLFVPVNPLAERHRHNGFGFTGYTLVLSGRSVEGADPPAAAAWLTARFPQHDVIVVERGIASAWKGRALRGRVPVDSRIDLWRLVAHAKVCVDLAPGSLIGRECVEALRFGTPIVVPHGSGPAEVHANSGGGSSFRDPEELFQAVAAFDEHKARSAASGQGRAYAEGAYGDALSFVSSLRHELSQV